MASWKMTVVLASLAVVLGVVAVVAESLSHRYTESGTRILFEYDRTDAVRVKIEYPGSGKPTVVAERTEGGWKLLEPLEGEADPQTVERVVACVCELKATAHWRESDRDMAELAKERIVIEVKTREGKTHWVKVGQISGSGFRAFARVSSAPGIWEISKGVSDAADRALLEFRQKRLFTVDYFSIEGVDLVRGSRTYRMVRRDEAWTLESPFPDRVNEEDLFNFLSEITNVRVEAFAVEKAGPAELKAHGLETPEATLTLHGKDKTSTVSFGKGTGAGSETWYARRHDRAFIARVNPKVVSRVAVDDVYRFRQRLLVPGTDRWEPVAVAVEGAIDGKRVDFKAEKADFGRWNLTAPITRTLDDSAEGAWGWFLDGLKGTGKEKDLLRVEEFVDETPAPGDLEKYGLGPKALKIEVKFRRTSRPSEENSQREFVTTIRIGRTVREKGMCYARVEGKPNIVGLSHTIVKNLARGYVRFLNRELLAINPQAVTWIEFEYKGKVARWERKSDLTWLTTKPVGAGTMEPLRMNAALGQKLTRAEAYVRWWDDLTVLEEYGLNPPLASLRITQKTGRTIGAPTQTMEIHFGKFKTIERLYATYAKGHFPTGDLVILLHRNSFNLFLEMWKEVYTE